MRPRRAAATASSRQAGGTELPGHSRPACRLPQRWGMLRLSVALARLPAARTSLPQGTLNLPHGRRSRRLLMARASAPSGGTAATGAQATAVSPELVQLAHSLADAAAAVSSRYFRTPVPVDVKSDASPVTIADREAEAAMRQLIAQQVGLGSLALLL